MTPKPKQEYSVRFVEWNAWEMWVTASSPEAAERQVRRRLNQSGVDACKHRDCGYEAFDVEEVQP
jgi:type IV pilus biogenesis protein CpaD/CtpE